MNNTTPRIHVALSDVPSQLLEEALNDLLECENDENYSINMYEWHYPDKKTGLCSVCLAGATLARKSDISPRKYVDTDSVDEVTAKKMLTIDMLRGGHVGMALNILDIPWPDTADPSNKVRRVPPYEREPVAFIACMVDTVAFLRSIGQ